MTVDKDFSLADMALQFRNLRSDDLTFLVSPQRRQQEDQRRGRRRAEPDQGRRAVHRDPHRQDGGLGRDQRTQAGGERFIAPSTKASTKK